VVGGVVTRLRELAAGAAVVATIAGLFVMLAMAAPAHAVKYGAMFMPNEHPDEENWAGATKVARVFDSNGLDDWDDYPAITRAYDDGVRTFHISWKGTNPNQIRDFADTIPAGVKVYGTWQHEPEDDIKAGNFTLAYYKSTTVALAEVMREEGIVPVQVLMGYTLYPARSHRKVADYDLPPGTVTLHAFDGHVRDKTPLSLVRRLVKEYRRTGIPTAIPETSGSPAHLRQLRDLIQSKVRAGRLRVSYACAFTLPGMRFTAQHRAAWLP
jgi:hypothetical protein